MATQPQTLLALTRKLTVSSRGIIMPQEILIRMIQVAGGKFLEMLDVYVGVAESINTVTEECE